MDLKNPTRTEALLANIAGHTDVPVPDMKNATRSERLLKEILDNGGGGGGDVTKEYVDNAIADAVADIDDDISALSDTVADKVDKVNGKSLSTNDYTDADKALVQDSPITVTATGSDLTLSTANGKPRKLTIYGKSEVVDGVIKSAGEGWSAVRLADLTWSIYSQSTTGIDGSKAFIHTLDNPAKSVSSGSTIFPAISNYKLDSFYNTVTFAEGSAGSNAICQNNNGAAILIRVATINTLTDLQTYLSNNPISLAYQLADPTQGNTIAVKTDNGTGIEGTMATFTTGTPLRATLDGTVKDEMRYNGITGEVITRCEIVNDEVVPLATPIITPLTAQEMTALAGLRTFEPQTHAQNNAGATMTIEAYAGTANGKAVADLKSELQITQSDTLTLTVAGWSNNTQTVTYEHDTGKRNSIDVEPANIKAWTAAGILATAETASTITFEYDTAPTADLSFRVTSMEVR